MSTEELLNSSDSKTGFSSAVASTEAKVESTIMENSIEGFPAEFIDEGLKDKVTAINAAASPADSNETEASTETPVYDDPGSLEGAQEESPEERWARLESLEAEVKKEAEERKLREEQETEKPEEISEEEAEIPVEESEDTADTEGTDVPEEPAKSVIEEESSEEYQPVEEQPEEPQEEQEEPFVDHNAEPDFQPMTEEPPELTEEEKAEIEAQNIAEGNMSLVDHLTELRKRLIRMILAITLGTGVAYFFLDEIMHHLMKPAGKLYYMQPAEAFFVYLKVCIFAGFLMAVPVVFYQGWKFLLPALTNNERKVMGLVLPSSVLLFFGGLTFSFLFVLPAGIKFFMGFGTEDLAPMFSIDKYISFVIAFVLPFGVIFELPLVIVILAKLGFISSALLRKYRKIVIFATFVIGAVISPTPDVFSQSMIAIPMLLLYEVSIVIVRYVLRK